MCSTGYQLHDWDQCFLIPQRQALLLLFLHYMHAAAPLESPLPATGTHATRYSLSCCIVTRKRLLKLVL